MSGHMDIRQALLARLGAQVPAALLDLALTHPSAVGEERERVVASNQRLEFLGDAVVGAVVAEHFYRTEPDLAEGELTRRKIAAVRREALAGAGSRLGLGQLLVFGRGEGTAGGAARPSNVSDAFEAVVGALFLAAGWDAARAFVIDVLGPELQIDVSKLVPAKNRLQELTQAIGLGTPRYRTGAIDATSGNVSSGLRGNNFSAEVLLLDEVRGRGQGSTKRAAEEVAAAAALEAISSSARGEDDK